MLCAVVLLLFSRGFFFFVEASIVWGVGDCWILNYFIRIDTHTLSTSTRLEDESSPVDPAPPLL